MGDMGVKSMRGSQQQSQTSDVTKTVHERVREAWSTTSNTTVVSNRWPMSMQVWQLDLFVRFEDGAEMSMPTTECITTWSRSAPSVRESTLQAFGIPASSEAGKCCSCLEGIFTF